MGPPNFTDLELPRSRMDQHRPNAPILTNQALSLSSQALGLQPQGLGLSETQHNLGPSETPQVLGLGSALSPDAMLSGSFAPNF